MLRLRLLVCIVVGISLVAPTIVGTNISWISTGNTEQGVIASPLFSSGTQQVQTYGIGLGGAPVIMDESTLSSMAGGTSVSQITAMIQEYLVPLNVQFVFVDPGWSATSANTSSTYVLDGFQQWIADWLEASAPFGIKTAFFFLQWGYPNTGWTVSFLNEYPQDATVNSSGSYVAACYACDLSLSAFSITDGQDLYAQMKEDLNQFYKWYGQYGDWIGFGEGATGDRNNYAPTGNAIQTSRPWDNGTLDTFANSAFFLRTINSTGYYLGTNTLSKLWSEFLNDRPDISFSSGVPDLTSYPIIPLYGLNRFVLERFYIPSGTTLNGFRLSAYLSEIGSPNSQLIETIYPDNSSNINGHPVLDEPLTSQTVTGISSSPEWVTTAFSGVTLAESNYYWVGFSTTGGDTNDYYNVYEVGQPIQSDLYSFIGASGISSIARNPSSPILWIQTLSGQTVTLYPVLNGGSSNLGMNPGNTFYIEAPSQTKVNMIAFFTSDRAYDPNNVTMSLQYPNGTTLATGIISTVLMNGAQGLDYLPYQLSSTVSLYPNIKYQIVFSSLSSSDNYAGSAQGGISQDVLSLQANPSSAGYLGQSQWPLFEAGLMTIEPNTAGSNANYESSSDLFSSPGYQANSEIAMRFTTTQSETLETFSINVIKADSISSNLDVSLTTDDTSCLTGGGVCSHPSSTVLASGSISFASINSTFIACPTTTGKCTFANVTFAGSTSLSANTNYWLVMSATNNGYLLFDRLVSPYKNLVYYSTSDFTTSWGVPPDGPTDLSYKITTTGDVLTNTVLGQAVLNLGSAAQSFGVSSPVQIKGLWLYASTGGVANLNISIETDSGSDSPSGTILASGLVPNYDPGLSFNYVSLDIPLNLTASTKYWIVVSAQCIDRCSGGSPEAYADVFKSDYPGVYGGSGLYHYEKLIGSSWTSPAQRGSMNFILAASDSTINTYNTSQLYNEISTYEANSYSGGAAVVPLQGWNAFLDYYQSSLMYNLTQYMQSAYGQHMYWVSGLDKTIPEGIPNFNASYFLSGTNGASGPIGCDPSVPSCGGSSTGWLDDTNDFLNGILSSSPQTNTLPLSSIGSEADNGGDLTSPSDLQTQYLLLPLLDSGGTLTYNDWAWGNSGGLKGLDNLTVTSAIRNQFGPVLSRMVNYGGYFGTSKDAVRVLWIGSQNAGGDGFFPEFLTPAINLTLSSVEDSNQTTYGNFSQFNVIVGYPNTPTASFIQRYDNFVKGGGGAVDTSLSVNQGANYVMGYDVTSNSVTTSSFLSIEQPNPITNPYTSISYTPYWLRYQTVPVSNETPTVFVKDSNGNPVITANNYFKGIGVNIERPWDAASQSGNPYTFDGREYGSPRDSFVSLLINAIYYSANKSSMLPILWNTSYSQQQNWSPFLQYSIDGSPGNPVLVWVSNNGSSASNFDIHLSASFFGISTSGWVAINMQNMEVVTSGAGNDIHISTSVPAYSWMPIYVMSDDPTTPNLEPLYSTASIVSYSSSGSTESLGLQGQPNASSWIVLNANASINSVLSSITGNISSYPSLPSLNVTEIGYYCSDISSSLCTSWNAPRQQGWYYDATDSLLYVHFLSGTSSTLTIYSSGNVTSTSSSSSTTTQTTTQTTTTTSDKTSSASSTSKSTTTTTSSTSQTSVSSSTTTSTESTTQSSSTSSSSTGSPSTITITRGTGGQTVYTETLTTSQTTQSTTMETVGASSITSSNSPTSSSTSSNFASQTTSTSAIDTSTPPPADQTTSSSTSDSTTTISSTSQSSTSFTSTTFTVSTTTSNSSSVNPKSNRQPAKFSLDDVLGFIPGVMPNPTPFGNAIFAYEIALVMGLPFLFRFASRKSDSQSGSTRRSWNW